MPETSVGLVPEVYYDVIARLCAGAPFVILLTWRRIAYLDNVKMGVLLILGSYLAGHILGTVSAVLNAIIWRPFFMKFIVSHIPLENSFSDQSFRFGFHELYKRIDSIGRLDANGGTVLKKMEAGAALSDNLFAGFLILVIVELCRGEYLTWRQAALGLTIGVILLVTVVFRRIVLIGRQDTLWSSLVTRQAEKPSGAEE